MSFAGVLPGILFSRRIIRDSPEADTTVEAIFRAEEHVRTRESYDASVPLIILGGRGFIGRRLVRRLAGRQIHSVDPASTCNGSWPHHLRGTRAVLINVSRRATLHGYFAHLWPSLIIINEVLHLNSGENAVIGMDRLKAKDDNNADDQLTFTLVTLPHGGELRSSTQGVLKLGDQFTQADLDGGAIRYFSSGNTPQDGFRFTVTDGEGGFLATPKFLIQTEVVGTHELSGNGPAFGLFPNPATETVWVALGRPAAARLRVSLFNLNGQLIQNAELPVGADRLSIPVNTLPKGLYMVRLESASGAAVRKLVVE